MTQAELNTLNSYKTIVENQRHKIDQLEPLILERQGWLNEQANTYMGLGELEAVLFSEMTPAKKVIRCKQIIKDLNDPEYLEQFVG